MTSWGMAPVVTKSFYVPGNRSVDERARPTRKVI
jgi:hypothetical protein